MHYAAYNGNADAMYELIAAGAVVALENNDGYACSRCGGRFGRPCTLAVAACSTTAEDYAKGYGHAAAYADAIKRVLPRTRTRHRSWRAPCVRAGCMLCALCVMCARCT